MPVEDIFTAYMLDGACLTLEELCTVCAVEPAWVIQHVEEGLLSPMTGAVTNWRFTTETLTRTRRIHTLERDFEAVPELAALMADLLEEMDALRAQSGHHSR